MHPPASSGASRPPVSLTSLVGREREIRDLDELVRAQRLVTVTGPGGAGKTRLVAELALRLDWQRPDSVAWAELARCTDAALVPQHVGAALDLRAGGDRAVVSALVEALRDRELLLVLDDCEHLVEPTAALARELLVRCPRLRIVATSREPLGVPGEQVWPVPPIAAGEAVQLFAERAAAVAPAFALTDENRSTIAEICRRLDGMPLAIELAAARVRVLTPEQIASRLEDRFAILTGGARTAVARHRTLRAAIDWSYALLSGAEQQLLARLSVFAGSFSLEAAEAVCDADLDQLTSLVDKSLVAATSRRAQVRYHLLETIRQYAAERLADSGNAQALRRRHAEVFLAIAREDAVDPMGAVLARLDMLDAEYDNVRAALSWSLEHEPDAIALPLGAAFRWYWYYRILWCEGLRWTRQILDRASPVVSSDFASVVAAAGTFLAYIGDLEEGRQWLERAETMWRELGQERDLALTLSALSHLLTNAGELERAAAHAQESVTLARSSGTSYDVAYCLTNAAAFVAQRSGDLQRADCALEEAEAIWAPARHPLGFPFVLNARALLAVRRGDDAAARRFAWRALRETAPRREPWFSARSLRVLAYTSGSDAVRATTLLGAADAMLRAIGARMLVHETPEHERLLTRLREELPRDEMDALLRTGAALSFDEACQLALRGEDGESAPAAPRTLEVRDLGPLQITLAGAPLAPEARASGRARELLAFLLAHPSGRSREEVGVAFWPDAAPDQVKNSFHVTLHRLRKLLGGADTVTAEGARYRVAVPAVVASRRFEAEIATALRAPDAARLELALSLYEGDYLQGEEMGEWCLPIRNHLRQLHLRGLFALGQAYESRGRYAEAADTYTRVLARDPFHEAAARQLMICRARSGARSESLLVYRQLEQRLRDDLQASPEPETSTLYRRLRQNESV